MQPDEVFQIVAANFAQLGAAKPEAIARSILLKDRRFVGHRFRCGPLQAIWLADGQTIEFYGNDGRPLQTIELRQPPQPKAA